MEYSLTSVIHSKNFFKSLVRKLLIGLVLLEAGYILATSLFLNTPIYSKLVSLDPQELIVTFRYGWSWIPGRVHLARLKIQGQDRNVLWTVDLPKADLRIQLHELLSKRLHVTQLEGSQVRFQLTMKTEEEKKKLPPEGPDKPPELMKKEHWKIAMDHVFLSSVDRLQIQNFYFEGNAQIQGGFQLWPGLEAQIGPCTLKINSGGIHSIETDKPSSIFFDDLKGEFHVTIKKFEPFVVKGNDVLRFLRLSSHLDGKLHQFSVLNPYFQNNSAVHFDHGEGSFQLLAEIFDGRIQPPTSLKIQSKNIQLTTSAIRANGNGYLNWAVSHENRGSISDFTMALERYTLTPLKTQRTLIEGANLKLRALTGDLDLLHLFKNMDFCLSVPPAKISALSNWNDLWTEDSQSDTNSKNTVKSQKPPFQIEKGNGSIEAMIYSHFSEEGREEGPLPDGFINLRLNDTAFNYKDVTLNGKLQGEFKIAPIHLQRGEGLIRQFQIQSNPTVWTMRFPKKNLIMRDWWYRLSASKVHFKKNPNFRINGNYRFQIKNLVPLIAYLREKEDFSPLKQRLLSMDHPEIQANLQIQPKTLEANPLRLKSDTWNANGHLKLKDGTPKGKMKFHQGAVSIGVALEGPSNKIRLFPTEQWLHQAH